MEWSLGELFSITKTLNFSDIIQGCSQGEFWMLLSIDELSKESESGKVMVNKLADKMHISVPAVSKMLKNLDNKKLIKRVTDVFCRRITYVIFTAKGNKVLNSNIELIKNLFIKAFGDDACKKLSQMIDDAKAISIAANEGGELNASVK